MSVLVMKFGGTSVADKKRLLQAARHVAREAKRGEPLAVVVSAQAGATDHLLSLIHEVSDAPSKHEVDAILSSGEQVSAGLFALTLQKMGMKARSWQGWQLPILTDEAHGRARIETIETKAFWQSLKKGEIGVLSGFQGISPKGRVTTLGRGGSDASAVALAASLKAERCDIYTDVEGIFTADPRWVPSAKRLNRITYEEMLEMASLGARVLQTRSVSFAMRAALPLWVRSSAENSEDETKPGKSGTLVCREEDIVEKQAVSGITHAPNEAKITLTNLADRPGVAAAVFTPLAEEGISVDMIVQSAAAGGAAHGGKTDLTFSLASADLERAQALLSGAQKTIGFEKIVSKPDTAKVSIIGIGMRDHAGVAKTMFQSLADAGINIHAISTSEIKTSVLIDASHTKKALHVLHAAYDLDGSRR